MLRQQVDGVLGRWRKGKKGKKINNIKNGDSEKISTNLKSIPKRKTTPPPTKNKHSKDSSKMSTTDPLADPEEVPPSDHSNPSINNNLDNHNTNPHNVSPLIHVDPSR